MKPVRNGDPKQLGQGTCSACGKLRYFTRRDARRAARALCHAEPLRPYQCGQFWHIGHTPAWRKRGERR